MNYSIEILPQALDHIETAYRWMADNLSPERAEQWKSWHLSLKILRSNLIQRSLKY
jgi:hypothetical protein